MLKEDENRHRLEYSFGDDYTKRDGSPVAANNFTHTELEQLFNLMKLFGDYGWSSHSDLKPALTEIKGDNLILLPAKTNPMTKSDFKDFTPEDLGIPVDTNGNSNFYATNYGTRISDGSEYRPVVYSWDTKFEVKVEDNLHDWGRLINSFASEGYGDEKNKNKLISSFTNDPIKQLFADLRSYDTTSSTATDKGGTGAETTPNYDIFTDGTNHFSYQEFPEFYLDEEGRLDSLQVNKDLIAEEIKSGRKELDQAEKDYQAARKQLFAKEKEVDNKITAKITELRKELKEKYKVDDTTANDFTGDNKITSSDHYKFQQVVRHIRFLVNNDEEKPTGKTNEDNAYTASQNISLKVVSTWLQSSWDSIGWQEGASEETNRQRTDEEKITVIKENKDDKYSYCGLNWYHDCLVELEKLVKLSERETKIKTALKAAIDNQTPEENAKDWQNNLKALEAGLETAFTEEKIKQWKEKKDGQATFNTITSVNSLLKKVCQDGKANDDFLAFLKDKDTELISLEKLIEKKEPQEVILLIHQWEYNKLGNTKKAEQHLRYAWSELGGKQKVDSYELTDEDKKTGGNFEKFLYECAIGKINYNSLEKPTEQESPNNNESQDPKWWEKGFYWPIWTSALAVIGGLIAWWKRTDWFGGKKEEEGEETELAKETSEDEE